MFDKQRPDDIELAADLAALEEQLRRVAPAPLRVDRDVLMFVAGRAAGMAEAMPYAAINSGRASALRQPRRQWFWQAATATMTAATLLLSAMLVWRDERPAVIAQQDAKPQPTPAHVRNDETMGAAHAPPQVTATDVSFEPWSRTPPTGSGYLEMRNVALARGIGAIDFKTALANGGAASASELPPSRPVTARELLHELLPQAAPGTENRS